MSSVHKTLSIAVANAEALVEYGHEDVAYYDLTKAINNYDEVIYNTAVKRHYPTYSRASSLFFKLSRDM